MGAPYEIDPDDPRAPSMEVWAAMTPEQRRRVVASLPSELPRAAPPEGDPHSIPKNRAREALDDWFSRRGRSVYIASELPVYYPDERVFAPDLIAVLDVSKHERMSWVVAEEGQGLDFVLEIHVAGNRLKDTRDQVEKLARLGVPENFVFEPLARRISGHRLSAPDGRTYEPIMPQGGRWASTVLELELGLDEGQLRFFAGVAPLPHARELIDRLTGMVDDAIGRAEEESRRAEEESRRAEEESRRAERLAAKLRELGVDPDAL